MKRIIFALLIVSGFATQGLANESTQPLSESEKESMYSEEYKTERQQKQLAQVIKSEEQEQSHRQLQRLVQMTDRIK